MATAHTVVGSSVAISGTVAGDGDVTVNGRLEGSVELLATLNVGPDARVRADLSVLRAVVAGVVVGNINARESVELLPGARVLGDVATPRFIMRDGALFKGRVRPDAQPNRTTTINAPSLMPALAPPAPAGRVDLLRPPPRPESPRSEPPRTSSRPPEAVMERRAPTPPPTRPPAPVAAAPVEETTAPGRPTVKASEPLAEERTGSLRAVPAAPTRQVTPTPEERTAPARALPLAPPAARPVRLEPRLPAPPESPEVAPARDEEEGDVAEESTSLETPAARVAQSPSMPPAARPLPGKGSKKKVLVKRR